MFKWLSVLFVGWKSVAHALVKSLNVAALVGQSHFLSGSVLSTQQLTMKSKNIAKVSEITAKSEKIPKLVSFTLPSLFIFTLVSFLTHLT